MTNLDFEKIRIETVEEIKSKLIKDGEEWKEGMLDVIIVLSSHVTKRMFEKYLANKDQ